MISPLIITQAAPGLWHARCHHPACPPVGKPHTVRTGQRAAVERAADRHLKQIREAPRG